MKTSQTDLAVLKPFKYNPAGQPGDLLFSRWLAELPPQAFVLFGFLACLWPVIATAQSNYSTTQAFEALWRWLPFILSKGFLMNVVVSFLTMLVGTIAGVLLGLGQLSPIIWLNRSCWFITQLFRNSPWMNWYAILTMATPLISLLGVEEIITLSRQAMEAEDNHPELLVPFFGFSLFVFFVYCYPIARYPIKLEKRFLVEG